MQFDVMTFQTQCSEKRGHGTYDISAFELYSLISARMPGNTGTGLHTKTFP